MKSITLTTAGFAIAAAFTTVVRKITTADGVSKVVLDEMPNVELSVNDSDVKELDLKKGSNVTLAPVGDADKSFTLTVNEAVAAAAPAATNNTYAGGKGSSPVLGMTFSNAL